MFNYSLDQLSSTVKSLCWDFKNERYVPTRGYKWLKAHHTELYTELVSRYPSIDSVTMAIAFIETGYETEDDRPMCKVCNDSKVAYRRGVINDVCSNRCAIKSDEVQERTKSTCIERYGSERRWGRGDKPFDVGEHHTHKHRTNLDKLSDDKFMTGLANKGDWREVAKTFNLSAESHSSSFRFMERQGFSIMSVRSKPEIEVLEYVQSLIGPDSVIHNDRQLIKPLELDILVPSKHVAIEFDGVFWHSSGSTETDRETKTKHVVKTNACEELGYKLFHIFENEWLDPVKQAIWKSIISVSLGCVERRLYARKCMAVDLTNSPKLVNEFLDENHLQSSCKGVCRSIGLYYNGELVQVATFGKPRFNRSYDVELLRLCTAKNTVVVGGSSKLLKSSGYKEILSYGNRRWCSINSNVYDTLKSELLSVSEPCYFYFKNNDIGNLKHRSAMMKHKLSSINGFVFDKELTEVQNCYANNYRRLWDSGNLVYKISIKN